MGKESVQNVKKYAFAYLLIFFIIAVTPFLAMPIARLFDGVTLTWYKGAEGKLRPFFSELFTCIFWVIEFAVLFYLSRKNKQKSKNEAPKYESMVLEGELAVAQEQNKQSSVLPLRNVMFLFLITAFCILLLSLQIGFQVKPFYDFGEKISPISVWGKCGELARNAIKCIWIAWLLRISYRLSESVMGCFEKPRGAWIAWLITAGLLLCYGIYDVLITANAFAWTYLLFYLAFVGVYYFTEKHEIKSFLLILFIYIF